MLSHVEQSSMTVQCVEGAREMSAVSDSNNTKDTQVKVINVRTQNFLLTVDCPVKYDSICNFTKIFLHPTVTRGMHL